jgi:hypothetical protein
MALIGVFVLAAAGPDRAARADAPKAPAAGSMKEQRKAAADRRRRIIINNDGGAVARRAKEPTVKAILDDDMTALVGSQVDTMMYCSKSAGFGVFTHPTKYGSVFTLREDIFSNNQTGPLLAAGIDSLKVVVDFCKQQGIEIFWSMRMNDTHDGSRTTYAPVIFKANKLKVEHPEYLIGTPDQRPKYGAWSAVDYARPEIRDLALKFFEEVCQNYNVDGIELDFSRHPVLFKSTSRGEPATNEELAMMTDLVRRIRAMTEKEGQKRGRPILIAMRVPDSVEYSRAIGLDLERWLADDLFDLLVVANYFQINDWPYSVALARKHGVKVYPSLDESRAGDDAGKAMRNTNEAYRARAAEIWQAGADGVYVFNAPPSESPLWRELGEPQTLAKLGKDYFASVRGAVKAAGGNLPYEPFQKIETLNPKNPKPLKAGESAEARLNVADDFSSSPGVKLTLRMRFDSPLDPALVTATLNGRPLKLVKAAEEGWLESSVPPAEVRRGQNQIGLTLSKDAQQPPKWLDLLLQVRH